MADGFSFLIAHFRCHLSKRLNFYVKLHQHYFERASKQTRNHNFTGKYHKSFKVSALKC